MFRELDRSSLGSLWLCGACAGHEVIPCFTEAVQDANASLSKVHGTLPLSSS